MNRARNVLSEVPDLIGGHTYHTALPEVRKPRLSLWLFKYNPSIAATFQSCVSIRGIHHSKAWPEWFD